MRKMDNQVLREKTKSLKNDWGISYVSITKKLGWGETTLYRWLKGEFNLSQEKIEQITNLLKQYGRME